MNLDTPLEDAFLDCWCIFITIQQWYDSTASRDFACLVLEDTDGEEETFRRIGTMVFKHNLGLKMRYWMTRDLNENVWNDIEKLISNRQYRLRVDRKREKEKIASKAKLWQI
tara:strand:+ start:140 stop:475 length:336 start_codon:yes stop_codon:yes gene_type:complete